MNNLSVFNFNSNSSVRTVQENNECWFVAKDICQGLDIKDPAQAVRDIESQAKEAGIPDTFSNRISFSDSGQNRLMSCVNEAGLNMLIFQSRKKSAFKFKYWIASEVLPSIRKTGEYKTPYKVSPCDNLSLEQADTLRDLLKDTAEKLPKEAKAKFMIQGWSKLKAHFGVSYRDIPQGEYVEAVSIVSRHVAEALQGEYLPKQNNQMFYGLRDGRYLVCVENGHTHIRDINNKAVVDARFTHTLRQNFKTLAQQLWLLSGEQKESVIDIPMENLPHVN